MQANTPAQNAVPRILPLWTTQRQCISTKHCNWNLILFVCNTHLWWLLYLEFLVSQSFSIRHIYSFFFFFSWLCIFFCAQFHTRIDFLHSQRKQIRYCLSASFECTMPAFWIDLKSDPISSRSKLFSLWWIVHKCIIHKIQENDKTSYYNSFLASY